MPKAIGVVEFRDHTGEVLDRVQGGQRYIIHRFGRPVAGLVTTTDLERLEEPVSEERASYTTDTAPDLRGVLDELNRQGLAGELAFNAYSQERGDKSAAIRALAEAILKVQALP